VSRQARAAALGGAALTWVAACVGWFDAGFARPAWLVRLAPGLAAVALALALAAGRAHDRAGGERRALREPMLWLGVWLAVLFRLPLAWQGAAAYVTADGALSGIVALHLRDGVERLVFVPHVPYSGSLKSHLAAPLSAAIDPARAFALASILFYGVFVGALHALGARAREAPVWTAGAAALYAAFAPAFVTRYSLSNDGNYVEVLALGTLACLLAVRWVGETASRGRRAAAIGVVLGLAFWCHILAVIPAAAVALFALGSAPRAALRALMPALGGFVAGAAPSLVWNGANGWASFEYLRPGGTPVGEAHGGPGPAARLAGLFFDHLPVLLGYDPGYAAPWDRALRAGAFVATALALAAVVAAARAAVRERCPVLRVSLCLVVVNVAVALAALPYLEGNPRYVLFLFAPLALVLARLFRRPRTRPLFAALVAFGALGSLAQAPGAFQSDRRWRDLAATLEAASERWCYTDFYIATKLNFLSEERVVCSAKLGPATTEYFFAYREAVERAPFAALVAVNDDHADKLERRLQRLGVTYQRQDRMKPILLRLSRKVDPEELFPGRDFPLR
jgi:hypothetical protein